MVRQWKEMVLTGYQGGGGDSYGEELRRLVFVLWAALMTVSVFAAVILFCADGISKESTKASAARNYGGGSACTAAGCGGGGSACTAAGCGGAGCGGGSGG